MSLCEVCTKEHCANCRHNPRLSDGFHPINKCACELTCDTSLAWVRLWTEPWSRVKFLDMADKRHQYLSPMNAYEIRYYSGKIAQATFETADMCVTLHAGTSAVTITSNDSVAYEHILRLLSQRE